MVFRTCRCDRSYLSGSSSSIYPYLQLAMPAGECENDDCVFSRKCHGKSLKTVGSPFCAICRIRDKQFAKSELKKQELAGLVTTVKFISKDPARSGDIELAYSYMQGIEGLALHIQKKITTSASSTQDSACEVSAEPVQEQPQSVVEDSANDKVLSSKRKSEDVVPEDAAPHEFPPYRLPRKMLDQGNFGFCSMYALAAVFASALSLKFHHLCFESIDVLNTWMAIYIPREAQWPDEPCIYQFVRVGVPAAHVFFCI